MSESRDDAQTKTRGTLLVVDGHSLAFRAFFALPAENFSTQAGQATNAVWGFATMLSQVLDSEKPDHLAVAFDMKGGTFRNEMLPQYKGTREAAPKTCSPSCRSSRRCSRRWASPTSKSRGMRATTSSPRSPRWGSGRIRHAGAVRRPRRLPADRRARHRAVSRASLQGPQAHDAAGGGGQVPCQPRAIPGSCGVAWRDCRQHPRRARRRRRVRGEVDQPVRRT